MDHGEQLWIVLLEQLARADRVRGVAGCVVLAGGEGEAEGEGGSQSAAAAALLAFLASQEDDEDSPSMGPLADWASAVDEVLS